MQGEVKSHNRSFTRAGQFRNLSSHADSTVLSPDLHHRTEQSYTSTSTPARPHTLFKGRTRDKSSTMLSTLQARYQRMEKALDALVDSVTAYNPSVTAADELVAADEDVNEGLEERRSY